MVPIWREGAVVDEEKRERRAARMAKLRRQPSEEEMSSSTLAFMTWPWLLTAMMTVTCPAPMQR